MIRPLMLAGTARTRAKGSFSARPETLPEVDVQAGGIGTARFRVPHPVSPVEVAVCPPAPDDLDAVEEIRAPHEVADLRVARPGHLHPPVRFEHAQVPHQRGLAVHPEL